MECPACNIEMEPLISGIFQCLQCKKIVKHKYKAAEAKEKSKIEKGIFQNGEYFRKNVTLNTQSTFFY